MHSAFSHQSVTACVEKAACAKNLLWSQREPHEIWLSWCHLTQVMSPLSIECDDSNDYKLERKSGGSGVGKKRRRFVTFLNHYRTRGSWAFVGELVNYNQACHLSAWPVCLMALNREMCALYIFEINKVLGIKAFFFWSVNQEEKELKFRPLLSWKAVELWFVEREKQSHTVEPLRGSSMISFRFVQFLET